VRKHSTVGITAHLHAHSESITRTWTALSDIFAAVVDRLAGKKSEVNTWLIGEDVVISGVPFRDMSSPADFGHSDYYPGMSPLDSHQTEGIVLKGLNLNVSLCCRTLQRRRRQWWCACKFGHC
jgi:Zn-dependent metalloprotease